MPELLIHKKTSTIFQSTAQNKTKYKAASGAIFPIHECEQWKENFPMLACEMPPEVGQVAAYGEHIFTVVRRAIDKESGQKRLWYCEITTKLCGFYPLEDCSLVSDELIEKWVEAIAFTRHLHKEDSPEYRAAIKQVPEPIRDLCIVRSFNKILGKMALGDDYHEIF